MIELKCTAIIITLVFISGCSENDRRYSDFKSNFKDSIEKYEAEEFNYSDDGLIPQKSYFVNGKLKYLVLNSSGELCDSESFYTFDLKTDSLIQKIKRSECYETSDRVKRINNIILVKTQKSTEQFYDNGVSMKIEKSDNGFEDNSFIYKIKINTENAYQKR